MRPCDQLNHMTAAEIECLVERSLGHLGAGQDAAALPVLMRLARSVGTAIGTASTHLGWTDRQRLPWSAAAAMKDAERLHASGSSVSGADNSHAPSACLTFYGINESVPGPRWKALFEATWPDYRSWYLREGHGARPSLAVARCQLERYMPELAPTWERLVELTDGDETAARMLTLYDPPRFCPGCSQAALIGPTPMLVRNYDYDPGLCERVVYSTAFTGRRVIGMGDCLWGLLDGMNERGLAVSLAFGGREDTGKGFAIPLVVRYLLEVAETVAEVIAVLTRLAGDMAYNLTFPDRNADVATIFVAPGTAPEVSRLRAATNHRGTIPDRPRARVDIRSVERQQTLLDLLAANPDPRALVAAFQRPPVYNTAYANGFGTCTRRHTDPMSDASTMCGQARPGSAASARPMRRTPPPSRAERTSSSTESVP